MKPGKWDARVERARALEKAYPFAAEGLRFYEQIALAQKALYCDLESHLTKRMKPLDPGTLRSDLDLPFLLPRLGPFLSTVEKNAPAALAESVHEIRARNGNHSSEMLRRFWDGGPYAEGVLTRAELAVSWAFLQPYAEFSADHALISEQHATPSLCPLCGNKPIVGVLRREGDGAKKSLICMLCAHEWDFRRIY